METDGSLEPRKENRFIAHLKKHKWKYITGFCVLAGGTIVYLIFRNTSKQVIGDITNSIVQTNPIDSPIIMLLRPDGGHPGFYTRCVETGELFNSQKQAAEAVGTTSRLLGAHLKGLISDIDGLHFERLGMVA